MKNLFFFFAFITSSYINAQVSALVVTEVSNMPMAISNNPVVEGWANDTGYVYSFGGIDSTKIWSGISNKSFRYNTVSDVWDTIPDLPNPNAVIAAGASYVDSIIYIMGGYRVLSNGNEISSNIVNRFDPRTNTYLSNGTNIPVATDDHVQAVYQDSLIYLITGWNNNGNIPNVQIYDPANDNWLVGTPVPNNNTYKAFGASGTIVGNTIYYHGGASTGTNFPVQSTLRIGQINPTDPTQITWTSITTSFSTYRAACTFGPTSGIYFLGGSEITYNYNGIAYNGSGGVPTKSTNLKYDLGTLDSIGTLGPSLPMDLRGVANFDLSWSTNTKVKYIAGGMQNGQIVSNKSYKIDITFLASIEEDALITFQLYPNPASELINLVFKENKEKTISLFNLIGKEVFKTESNKLNLQLDVSSYPKGIYYVKVDTDEKSSTQKIIIQ